ncbi:GNAT family N-acetyltransferase [Staphylococcus gallinarum]|uniref:GNAT family N-acetyltransferase n=1 Tax=Staphylococcus gallinarum TaxID=1293 RepID=A0A3A0VSU0_STAGA|nr:GNAT family N-acetyltransferase [Staphylococcus gallinarum]RIP37454.1 GNAT family N-acetyltransferase [Staphylococcus gallinarum]
MDNIFQQGEIFKDDINKTIYLTPNEPLVYDTNKWEYKHLPAIAQFKKDILEQAKLHQQQNSLHLAFVFPENTLLSKKWLNLLESYGFELGIMELYGIEASDFPQSNNMEIAIEFVSAQSIEDYIQIYKAYALPYGEAYANESIQILRNSYLRDNKERLIAYKAQQPVGILDLIISDNTVEIDGFGVLPEYQRQGIGTVMQSYVARYAGRKPMILVADGEDTAKDMYIKQGYQFLSFKYQILKEQFNYSDEYK